MGRVQIGKDRIGNSNQARHQNHPAYHATASTQRLALTYQEAEESSQCVSVAPDPKEIIFQHPSNDLSNSRFSTGFNTGGGTSKDSQKGARCPAQGESEKHRANRASCLSLGVGCDAVATEATQEISESRLKPASTGPVLLPLELPASYHHPICPRARVAGIIIHAEGVQFGLPSFAPQVRKLTFAMTTGSCAPRNVSFVVAI